MSGLKSANSTKSLGFNLVHLSNQLKKAIEKFNQLLSSHALKIEVSGMLLTSYVSLYQVHNQMDLWNLNEKK